METTTTTTPTDIYIPPGCTTLDKVLDDQMRVGIQGYPFTGKTFAALSFPNPVILSIDRKTNAHQHRTDAINVPFYDVAFINKLCPKEGVLAPPRRKEALLVWLSTEGIKLKPTQTLIVDGSTGVEAAYHMWFRFHEDELATTKGGGRNEFIEWRLKGDFFEELNSLYKSIPCNVVYICHETPDRDKKGEINGQIRPLLTGQAGDRLCGNFTDWLRAITVAKPENEERLKAFKAKFELSDSLANEWLASTPQEHKTIYLWQSQADETCKCGSSSMINQPKFVLANYSSFLKYRNKHNQTKPA